MDDICSLKQAGFIAEEKEKEKERRKENIMYQSCRDRNINDIFTRLYVKNLVDILIS